MTLLFVSFPTPVVSGEACDRCDGAGVLATQKATLEMDDGRLLLVDVFCPACDGCGSEGHGECADGWHSWDDDDDPEREDADALADRCLSCSGRGWNAVVGFEAESETAADAPAGSDSAAPREMRLRLPCGCQESRAKPLEQVEF